MTGSGLKGTGGGGGGGAPQSSSSDFSSSESGEAARGTEFLIKEGTAGAIGAGGAGATGELIVAEAGGGLGAAAEESIDAAGKGGIARLPVGAGDIVLTLDAMVQSLARLYPSLRGRTYQRHFHFPLPPSVSSLAPVSQPKITYSHWAEEGRERAHGRRRMQPSCP